MNDKTYHEELQHIMQTCSFIMDEAMRRIESQYWKHDGKKKLIKPERLKDIYESWLTAWEESENKENKND